LVSGKNKEYSIAFGEMTKEKNPENPVDPVQYKQKI
jgi:hypothetical protein